MNRLSEIFEHKRLEVAVRKSEAPQEELRDLAAAAAPALDFAGALRAARRPALIAEVKAASPSRGELATRGGRGFDPVALARLYAANGAAAISVLTDERFFRGSLDHLRQVRAALPHMPLLRKDFICDAYQVHEARAAGADAILLIVAQLLRAEIIEFAALARALDMASLVEVHSEAELTTALETGATLIGINNRDLRDFTVKLDTAARLSQSVPPEVLVVGESGIFNAGDVARLSQGRGVDAVLVGEALVTAPDIAAKARELSGHTPEVSHDPSGSGAVKP
jgi:indole-3-glycerol phosphate synthase